MNEVNSESITDSESVDENEFDNHRNCNIRKVLNLAMAKKKNSEIGMQMLRFTVFLLIYIGVLFLQRDAYNSESLYSGLRKKFAETPYRDPVTLELKTWLDVITVQDFWNWHQFLFIPSLLQETPSSPETATTEPYTILGHNKLINSFRMTLIRSQAKKCEVRARKYVPLM